MFVDYEKCTLCSHCCGANRAQGELGVCGCTDELRIGRAALHFWEEPCISGENGAGAVFFSGCTLNCIYCQNYMLSVSRCGESVDVHRLSEIFFELKKQGAHNINLVTPEHFTPHIEYAIREAKGKKIGLPFIYNCGGYTSMNVLERMNGLIDVYLPDFKYFSSEISKAYSNAKDYPKTAMRAIDEMVRQQPRLVYDEEGMLKKGVLVRHLCLPGHVKDSKNVIEYLYKTYGDSIALSIMSQYTPMKRAEKFKNLTRCVSSYEYESVLDFCMELGIENAYIQESGAADESFIPEFNGEGIKEYE